MMFAGLGVLQDAKPQRYSQNAAARCRAPSSWDLPDRTMGREEAAVTVNQEQRAMFFNINTTNVCA